MVPNDRKYTESHEWVKLEDDGTALVGITDHAQAALGDIVFLELPRTDVYFHKGDTAAVIESVKAASDIYSPISGEVIEFNQAAQDAPELVNADAHGTWLFRLKPSHIDELSTLLDADAYEKIA